MKLHKKLKGFTLIEVMVALTIVALSLTALTASMSQMIDAAHTMRDRTYASWIAQNRITEIRLQQGLPEPGSTNGEVLYANTDWTWRAIISETGVEELYRIDVSVSLAGSDDVIRSVSGFVGSPGAVGEANRVWMRGPQTGPQSGSGATS
ncbi:MAG: type II secretion system minor pseudopilin GspI [Gammaproteobacteria bacterium]|nr:type II secretion system minor pseudopilin GspI [Gammaproteobacteria bacterium]